MEDAQIIELYWQREEAAIAETSEKYGAFLLSVAWNVLHVHHDAEECVNDTYLRAWNAIPPTRPTVLRTWLGCIARNLSLDRWKLRQAEKRSGDETAVLLGELDQCVPGGTSPERSLEERELAALISQFLRTLPRDSRLMFLRRYWYGDSMADIAKRFACGEGRIRSRLFRTRKALRAFLEKEGVLC